MQTALRTFQAEKNPEDPSSQIVKTTAMTGGTGDMQPEASHRRTEGRREYEGGVTTCSRVDEVRALQLCTVVYFRNKHFSLLVVVAMPRKHSC